MIKSHTRSQGHSRDADDSSLAALSRTLEALESRLSKMPTRSSAVTPDTARPGARPADALAPSHADNRTAPGSATPPAARRPSLSEAVSEIVMRRQMLDRMPHEADGARPAPARDLASPAARPIPDAASRAPADERLDQRFRSLAGDVEALKAEGSGYSLMAEVAEELQRLRQDLRQETLVKADPRFGEMRDAFDDLRQMIETRASADVIGPELKRVADGLARLTEEGADRSTLNTLRAELEEMRSLFGEMAREKTVRADRRWDELESRYTVQAERETEAKRDLKHELERLRESLRTLASEDHIKAVEKRWDDFETRYLEVEPAPNEKAISKLLRDELEALREQLEGFSSQAPNEAAEKRWDALEERLDTREIETSIQRLAERMGEIEASLARLPQSLGIGSLEGRVHGLAQAVEMLAGHTQAPELDHFLILEERLDEISRAIVATSSHPQPVLDMAPIERIEARIATLTSRVDRIAADGDADMLSRKIADLSARVSDLANNPVTDLLAERMSHLAERLELAFAELEAPSIDTAAIEARLSALALRLEDAVQPQVDPDMMRSLESQIARLSQHLGEVGRTGPAEIDQEFDRRLAAIEQRLDEQRDALIVAAREVADETARRMQAAGDRRQSEHVAQLSDNLRSLEALSRQTDERAGQVFDSLHSTLMKIVDRLEQIELEIGGRTSERAEAPDARRIERAAAGIAGLGHEEAPHPATTPAPARRGDQHREETASRAMAGEALLDRQAPARAQVSAPALDASEMIERREANRPLEPGSGAPDIGALLDRLQLQRGRSGATRDPVSDGDLVAAARRASKAAAAEADLSPSPSAAGSAGEGRAGLAALIAKRRKPILVAILAVVAALSVLPLKQALLPSDPADVVALQDGSRGPETPASAPAVERTDSIVPGSATPVPSSGTMPVDAAAAPRSEAIAGGPAPSPSRPTTNAAQVLASVSPSAPAPLAAKGPGRKDAAGDTASIKARAEAKLPATASGEIPPVPEGIGSPALNAAAKAGDPKALFEIGLRLMEGRRSEPKPAAALDWFAQSAARGFAPAQYSLGTLFEKGNGVARDTVAARDWYRLAADQGNVRAMHNLAVLYATGVDGVSEPETAVTWFEKAAQYGMRDSQYNLGILYARGSGTDQNLAQSYKWFAVVAKSGDKDAEGKQEEIAKSLSPEQMKAAAGLVAAWTPTPRVEAVNTVELPPEWADASDTTASVDMNRAVRNIQAILGKLGYDAGVPDGVIGEKTKIAITAFQKQAGLKPTGEVDEPLIRALLERKNG